MQAPLYLPSNSELQVSIWRLTNQRQVWYEWYAESFMPVFKTPPPAETSDDTYTVNGRGSFFASASTPIATPSPLIDAVDVQAQVWDKRNSWNSWISGDEFKKADLGVVKIGQTSLHNPGGKSSWIGL